jgi:type I restriction enzyme R subunit
MPQESEDFNIPDLDEASTSQIPAVLQLVNMGYSYISRSEINKMRGGKNRFILTDITKRALRKINGKNISDKSIEQAVYDIEKVKLDNGVFKASEFIYSNLISGKAVSEYIGGRKTSPQLYFIDFDNPQNNQFHIAVEFEVSEVKDRRPDIVLFINGFPLAVMENKKESVDIDEAVKQMLRNQQGNNIPEFFLWTQVLVCANVKEVKYATMLTPMQYYGVWKERSGDKEYVEKIENSVNSKIDEITLELICADIRKQYKQVKRKITPQDKAVFGLLEPVRMLDIIKNFIIYDKNVKKIARYQQYFAVKKTLERISETQQNGKRKGGLIWHTQGSGKSLTMVMLVKALVEKFHNPRVLIITDRIDLDKQIKNIFEDCGINRNVKRAANIKELKDFALKKTLTVTTSLIQKFDLTKWKGICDQDDNLFILIDEAHRSQNGKGNDCLNLVFPKAAQIAFTGTPLMKAEKSSERKYGGMIDSYTISEAQDDGAILPLVYQGRFVNQSPNNENLMDKFYESITENLNEEQKEYIGGKILSLRLIEQTAQRIDQIALDVGNHYKEFYQGTGLKAQVVMPSKYSAVMFYRNLEAYGKIKSAVIMSDSVFADEDDALPQHKKEILKFLTEEKRRFGTLQTREENIISDFKDNSGGIEILIVVDKLLTGFDAPRNTVLYLAKQLKDHNLLQAIARVNRLYEGENDKCAKTYGLIIDYSKNAKNLHTALQLFSNYDGKDIKKALFDTSEKIKELENTHSKILSIFNAVKNKKDINEYLEILKAENSLLIRKEFYELLNNFINTFSLCRSLYDFMKSIEPAKIERYCLDMKKFIEIKKITELALGKQADFSKYEEQIRKILDKYVTAQDVEELSRPIDLSNLKVFNKFIEDEKNGLSDKNKADAIIAQTDKIISRRFGQDPVFYAKFSQRIKKLIYDLKTAQKEDLQALLNLAKDLQKQVANYEDGDIPQNIRTIKKIHPFYRNLKNYFKRVNNEIAVKIIKDIYLIIEKEQIVDWDSNIEVKRIMTNNIEDYLFDEVKGKLNMELSIEDIEHICLLVWDLAVKNK